MDRLLGECGIPKDSPAGRQQLERMLEERRRAEEGEEFEPIRRGWCLGEETFRQELLAHGVRDVTVISNGTDIAAIPDREFFGVQYDPSNALVAGDNPLDWLAAVQDRVVSMHASDRWLSDGATLDELRQSDGTLGYSPKLQHGVVGKGLNDFPAIFTLLAKNNYSGWISIEDGMNGMEEMVESLAYLHRMVDRYFGGSPAPQK